MELMPVAVPSFRIRRDDENVPIRVLSTPTIRFLQWCFYHSAGQILCAKRAPMQLLQQIQDFLIVAETNKIDSEHTQSTHFLVQLQL